MSRITDTRKNATELVKGDTVIDEFGNFLTVTESSKVVGDDVIFSTEESTIEFYSVKDAVNSIFAVVEDVVQKTAREFTAGDTVMFETGKVVTITYDSVVTPNSNNRLVNVYSLEDRAFFLANDENPYLILTA